MNLSQYWHPLCFLPSPCNGHVFTVLLKKPNKQTKKACILVSLTSQDDEQELVKVRVCDVCGWAIAEGWIMTKVMAMVAK